MNCVEEGILQAQLDGELAEAASLAVEQHLTGCVECRRRAAEMEARHQQVCALLAELAPLPGEAPTDARLALAQFKARRAVEEETLSARRSFPQLDDPARNGHRAGAQIQADLLSQSASPADDATGSVLSFTLPETGGLLARLVAAVRQFADDFGRSAPRWRPNEADEFRFLLAEETLLERLRRELITAAQDFRRDPRGFLAEALRGEGRTPRRRRLMQTGLASAMLVYAFVFTSFAVAGLLRAGQSGEGNRKGRLVFLGPLFSGRSAETRPNDLARKGKDNAAGSKAKPEGSTGGGGGGREQQSPASKGNLPQASLQQQIVMPNPEPPKITNPSLPVPMTVYADPGALPEFKGGPIGLPTGVEGPPSSGPGKGAGIGTGQGTGVGQGRDGGVGPGYGGNVGGGGFGLGGSGGEIEIAGRGGAGLPKILYKERAKYTEEARRNKVQGTVMLSAVFTTDGRVVDIRVIRGLPDGLTETAIEAAQKIRFLPAIKNGAPVTVRATLEFNFALY
jgi:TonB family protein